MWMMGLAMVVVWWGADVAMAATAKEIDVQRGRGTGKFRKRRGRSQRFLATAKGLSVGHQPGSVSAGVRRRARINSKTVNYYSHGGSFGLQFDAQAKTIVLVFLDEDALRQFRKSEGWKVGVDGSVAVIAIGAGRHSTTPSLTNPSWVCPGQKGLMYNLTLEGSKFTRINK
jgi:lipid-binding SYLF domain-containing protein